MPLINKYNLGLYRAIVRDSSGAYDPTQVTIEILDQAGSTGDSKLPDPAKAANPFGLASVPKVGSYVWVMFAGGDIRKPVIIGQDDSNVRFPELSVSKIVLEASPSIGVSGPGCSLVLSPPTTTGDNDRRSSEVGLNTGYGESFSIITEDGENAIGELRIDLNRRLRIGEDVQSAVLQYDQSAIVVSPTGITLSPDYTEKDGSYVSLGDTYFNISPKEITMSYKDLTTIILEDKKVVITSDETLIGSSEATESMVLGDAIKAYLDSFVETFVTTWVPVPVDGGASLKAAISAWKVAHSADIYLSTKNKVD